MKAYSPFLESIGDRIVATIGLLVIAFAAYPESHVVALISTAEAKSEALVFKIDSNKIGQVNTNGNLTFAKFSEHDPLVIKVKQYLEGKKSPLAEYATEIVQQPQWKRALAISYVESNFGRRCADNNCSGIGVHPTHPAWRRYPTKLHWFKDMNQLLEKPIYKVKYTTCEAMKGVYVVPGSAKWVNGCNKVINELTALEAEAEQERIALMENPKTISAVNSK
jgi:hypothetical protein